MQTTDFYKISIDELQSTLTYLDEAITFIESFKTEDLSKITCPYECTMPRSGMAGSYNNRYKFRLSNYVTRTEKRTDSVVNEIKKYKAKIQNHIDSMTEFENGNAVNLQSTAGFEAATGATTIGSVFNTDQIEYIYDSAGEATSGNNAENPLRDWFNNNNVETDVFEIYNQKTGERITVTSDTPLEEILAQFEKGANANDLAINIKDKNGEPLGWVPLSGVIGSESVPNEEPIEEEDLDIENPEFNGNMPSYEEVKKSEQSTEEPATETTPSNQNTSPETSEEAEKNDENDSPQTATDVVEAAVGVGSSAHGVLGEESDLPLPSQETTTEPATNTNIFDEVDDYDVPTPAASNELAEEFKMGSSYNSSEIKNEDGSYALPDGKRTAKQYEYLGALSEKKNGDGSYYYKSSAIGFGGTDSSGKTWNTKTEDATGIRYVVEDGKKYYCAAMGTLYGNAGDKIRITTDKGNTWDVIIADVKSTNDSKNVIVDGQTRSVAHTHGDSYDMCEFLVESGSAMPQSVKTAGDWNAYDKFSGNITSITKIS